MKAGRFTRFGGPEVLEIVHTFPLAEIAEAHRVGKEARERAKFVLIVG